MRITKQRYTLGNVIGSGKPLASPDTAVTFNSTIYLFSLEKTQ
ncbi:hypothetical protein VCHC64A1_01706 [Vibrio cholerae HC-64A1]|nr:hypothetical protein ASZ80_03502 [Vibrio cholerae]EET91765.1 conserved hypothetical protein [Vibrio cholerae CIRS101]EEY41696.1 conserved hypothetical protein [Vibrio cholerae RC27]EEY48019.1 conserved hypothetical protein [Vibrio cholerae INDRE 91/1]EGR01253.1 hypothetical protein VCHCUF01_2380 [Vibrio cholerae HCUF01]EGR05334.1 hypothetical protein VCHC49A2_0542 [Vibrio cholerae HC-49A2]EGS49291.1 hypothetical protein VCHC40A1_1511 [Vibrio cholerae HC-40A1]EGS63560.1 hypothetical protei